MSFVTNSTQIQTIDIDAGSNSHRQFVLNTTNTTSSKLYYELRNIATPPSSGVLQANQGITFSYTGTNLIVNHNDGTFGSSDPSYPSLSNTAGSTDSITVVATNTVYGFSGDGTSLRVQYTVPTFATVSGPTVSSITADTIFVPSDTVSNTDFTLLKNGSAYANTNISLTGPGAQPPSDARGYTYALTYDDSAYYRRTIDSKSYEEFYYDNSWTSDVSGAAAGRQTTSNRILNVVGTIPSTTIINGIPTTGYTIDRRDRALLYDPTTFYVNGVAAIHPVYYGLFISGTTTNIHATLSIYNNVTLAWVTADFIVGAQQTMTLTSGIYSINVTDWVYSAEPEGDGYVAPVSTTSHGGGKPDRYPLIMTNLFNRNRSIYSIGMTHKDTWDLFL